MKLVTITLLATALLVTLTGCPADDVRYRTCDDARSAGAAPLHRGDPGWNNDLDRDGDGTACE